MICLTTYAARLELAQSIATGGPFNAAKVAVYTASPSPIGPGAVLTDFTLCTFDGSTPVAITWGSVYPGPDGSGYVDAYVVFTCMGASPGYETVKGFVITDTGGSILIAAEDFPAPVPLPVTGATLEFVIRVKAPPKPGSSVVVVG
jgi:hypothetical protein